MTAATFAETSVNTQHSAWLTTEGVRYALNFSRENIKTTFFDFLTTQFIANT
jgi:hypothetical protein